MLLPDQMQILPLSKSPSIAVAVPGSKSITNRALVLAALGDCTSGCELTGALRSEDTEVMVACLRQLGFLITEDWANDRLVVQRPPASPAIPASAADLYAANSGTTMRFVAALVSLGTGRYRLDGVPRMRERPIEDLLAALRQLGVEAATEHNNGCPPVLIESRGLQGGRARIKGNISSQFLSALLMIAPFARAELRIEVEGGLVSEPYVAMTLRMMKAFGLEVEKEGGTAFLGRPQPLHQREHYTIEPDASAASYFFAAAAILGGRVTVLGVPQDSLQGDVRFADVLRDMGCRVEKCSAGVTVHGRSLRGVDVDMNDISDTVMTLGAVACFAEGPTTIRNVAHIRHKETDRLTALAAELRKVGAEVEEFGDGLRITPRPLHGAVIDTYNDHRMAMSLALVGLKVPGVVINNPACVVKTYPGFFDDLALLR